MAGGQYVTHLASYFIVIEIALIQLHTLMSDPTSHLALILVLLS